MSTTTAPVRHIPTITVICTVAGVLAGAFTATWHSSSFFTGVQDSIAGLRDQLTLYHTQNDRDFVAARTETAQQIGALDHRVSALEAGRTAADQQLSSTAAAIAGLQAQTSAMQGSLQDLKSGIDAIRSDIGQMARTANAPLPRR